MNESLYSQPAIPQVPQRPFLSNLAATCPTVSTQPQLSTQLSSNGGGQQASAAQRRPE